MSHLPFLALHVGIEAKNLTDGVDQVVEVLSEQQAFFARQQQQHGQHQQCRTLTLRAALGGHALQQFNVHDAVLLEREHHAPHPTARPVRPVRLVEDALRLIDGPHRERIRVLCAGRLGYIPRRHERQTAVESFGRREHRPPQDAECRGARPHTFAARFDLGAGTRHLGQSAGQPCRRVLSALAVQVENLLRVHDAFLRSALQRRPQIRIADLFLAQRDRQGLGHRSRSGCHTELRQVRAGHHDRLGHVDHRRRYRAAKEPGEGDSRRHRTRIFRVQDKLTQRDRLVANIALLFRDVLDRVVQVAHVILLRRVSGVAGDKIGQHARHVLRVAFDALTLKLALQCRPL